jgi:DNA-binding HxlR family transcriptional regulator
MSKGRPGGKDVNPLAGIDTDIHEPARLNIMTQLYVIESADFLFLMRQTGLTFGNLSSHLSKLEAAGYVIVKKEFLGKKPHTMLRLTEKGRVAFRRYVQSMKQLFSDLSDAQKSG